MQMNLELIKRRVLPALVMKCPFRILQQCAGCMPVLPYYHIVNDEPVLHVKHLYSFRNVQQFKDDLDVFLKHYKAVNLHELLASLNGGRPLPENSFLLTFDDGFRELHDVIAPILLEKGVPATFFLIKSCLDNDDMAHHNKISLLVEHLRHNASDTAKAALLKTLSRRGFAGDQCEAMLLRVDYANRDLLSDLAKLLEYDFNVYLRKNKPYLTSDQVHNLKKRGFTLGGHSIDHPLFEKLPLEEQLRQTHESVRFVRTRFNLDYSAFAFPHHDTGVSQRFFEKIYSEGEMNVSFGTSGMLKERCRWHLQRFPMEKTTATAERIIAYNYARSMQKRLLGRHVIVRA
jgi:peptidoglycan/xylan/chitin deacetylase (PgdA/CDA1 family)